MLLVVYGDGDLWRFGIMERGGGGVCVSSKRWYGKRVPPELSLE